jgi:hypothetical protein
MEAHVAKSRECQRLGHRDGPLWPNHSPLDCDLAAGDQPCAQVVGTPTARPPWPSHSPVDCNLAMGAQPCVQAISVPMDWTQG